MKLLLTLILLIDALGQTPPKTKASPSPKRPAAVRESPLGPGEIACGREDRGAEPHPCDCMKHRLAAAAKAPERCMTILDDKARLQCGLQAEACNMPVVDADAFRVAVGEDGEPPKGMTQQCTRSCSRAKCRCCHT